MLTVLTLRGPLIAPAVWATLEMDVIVQVRTGVGRNLQGRYALSEVNE